MTPTISPAEKSDLWQFWVETAAELASVPPEAEVIEQPQYATPYIKVYLVALNSLGGVRIGGWYAHPVAHPVEETPKRYPGLLELPGYGGRGYGSEATAPWEAASRGYAVLALDPRGQGVSQANYDLGATERLVYHITDLRRYHYRGAYMDCCRGLDFLVSRPEVDPERVGVVGTSQGGGLTLATASLDQRVKAATAELPFLCNYAQVIAMGISTYPYSVINDFLAAHPDEHELVRRNLSYFDPLNLVEKLRCPVLISMGLKDTTCPPETILPVFERINATKGLIVYPEWGHAHSPDFHALHWYWLDKYLKG